MNADGFNERKFIYIVKCFAILSVICAHSALVPENSSDLNYLISNLLHSLGSLGVPIFFILSGYLFYSEKKEFKEFVITKINSIAIPWLFCETIVWLYVVLRKGGITLDSWAKFILGFNHSTYYLTVLFIFFIVYFKIKNNLMSIVISSILAIISIQLTIMNVNPVDSFLNTPYLNPIGWMLYFSIGLLFGKYKFMTIFTLFCERYLYVSLTIFTFLLIFHLYNNQVFSYWSTYTLINTPISIILIFGLSKKISKFNINYLEDIGRQSFSIYLLHELVVGIVVATTSIVGLWIFILMRPFIVLFIVYNSIRIYKRITVKFTSNIDWVKLIGAK